MASRVLKQFRIERGSWRIEALSYKGSGGAADCSTNRATDQAKEWPTAASRKSSERGHQNTEPGQAVPANPLRVHLADSGDRDDRYSGARRGDDSTGSGRSGGRIHVGAPLARSPENRRRAHPPYCFPAGQPRRPARSGFALSVPPDARTALTVFPASLPQGLRYAVPFHFL